MSFNEGLLVLLLINNEEHHLEIFVGWGERRERESEQDQLLQIMALIMGRAGEGSKKTLTHAL